MPSGTNRDCPGYPGIFSISGSWDSMPGGTTRDCPTYPGILGTSGTPHLVGLPRTVLGIPGYLVPWCLMPGGTYWDGRTVLGILTTSWDTKHCRMWIFSLTKTWDNPGLSLVSCV